MHAADRLRPRLQRVLTLLRDGQAHTTRDIVRRARVMAVNACISELRHHGAEVECFAADQRGRRRFLLSDDEGTECRLKACYSDIAMTIGRTPDLR